MVVRERNANGVACKDYTTCTLNLTRTLTQWRKADGKFGGRGDDSACGPKFESIIHIIGHDKTSDTVEDNLY